MNRELDAARLPTSMGSMIGLWMLLVLGVWWGAMLGAGLIFLAEFAQAFLGPIGAAFSLTAFAIMIAEAGLIAFAGLVLLPLSATIAAAIKLHYARRFAVGDWALVGQPDDHPLTAMVIELSNRLGLKKRPSAMTMADVPNAFAMRASKDVSIVAVGEPILRHMTSDEVAFVVGHELGHIVSRDTQRKWFATEFQRHLTWFLGFHGLQQAARWVFAWIGQAALMFLSRHREYWADAIGAALTSKEAAVSALTKIETLPEPHTRTEMLNSEHMFFGCGRLFRTHPTTAQRVAAIESEKYISRLPFRYPPVEPAREDNEEPARPSAFASGM